MRVFFSAVLLAAVMPLICWADDYDQTITAIYGSGNPDGGWTSDSDGDITVALRAKDRTDGTTANAMGVYAFDVGTDPNNPARARWNWDFSIDSGSDTLDAYDYYVVLDSDPSDCVSGPTVNALTYWNDNSYGTAATANGQGVEGTSALATSNTVAQQSQNLVFAGGDPNVDGTYTYTLYAVDKNAGPDAEPLVSVEITVLVGEGGIECDTDGDGVVDADDHCPESDLRPFVDVGGGPTSVPNLVDADGCSIQDLVFDAEDNAKNHGQYVSAIAQLANDLRKSGVISNKQSSELKSAAAKSNVGK